MRVPQAEHLPRRASQLSTGMFSNQRMRWPQAGQREPGRASPSGLSSASDFSSEPDDSVRRSGMSLPKTRL
jgi:hypothetical protein